MTRFLHLLFRNALAGCAFFFTTILSAWGVSGLALLLGWGDSQMVGSLAILWGVVGGGWAFMLTTDALSR